MTTLKPFNLKKALAGDPVVTRDGRKVPEIYEFEKCNSITNIGYAIEGEVGIYTVNETGIRAHAPDKPSDSDIFMAPRKQKLWIAIRNKEIENSSGVHDTSMAYPSLDSLVIPFHLDVPFKIVEVEIEI